MIYPALFFMLNLVGVFLHTPSYFIISFNFFPPHKEWVTCTIFPEGLVVWKKIAITFSVPARLKSTFYLDFYLHSAGLEVPYSLCLFHRRPEKFKKAQAKKKTREIK